MKGKLSLYLKIFAGAVVAGLVILFFVHYSTKTHSPDEIVSYVGEDLELEVFYNRPYKKERIVFGELVPYGEVWRTGANEATTFSTNQDLMVDGSFLPAGKYTVWTIPMQNSWKVIFNSKMYPWGIDLDKKPYRDPAFDALVLEVPTNRLYNTIEQFSIYFEEANGLVLLILGWDQTSVAVPLKTAKEVQNALLLPKI